jgi:kumamolisin
MLLVGQLAEREGAGRLGYVNPMLYDLAAGAGEPSPFHDVVRGGNRLHRAEPGWDYATGLGSPDGERLARAVLTYLRRERSS